MAASNRKMAASNQKMAADHQEMAAFAYYRQPYLHHATYVAQHEGEPEVFSSVAELNGKEGFVIAPFSPSSDCPVLLIHPDETKLLAIEDEKLSFKHSEQGDESNSALQGSESNSALQGSESNSVLQGDGLKAQKHLAQGDALGSFEGAMSPCKGKSIDDSTEKQAYSEDFALFHEQLSRGMFRKIVLARKHTMKRSMMVDDSFDEQSDALKSDAHFAQSVTLFEWSKALFEWSKALFMRACHLYPRLFVALVYTPRSGMWLMATPEILLKGDGCDFSTMSLAGTQRAEPSRTVADYPVEGVEWSEKNQEEQQYVTDYIEQCVKTFTDDYSLKGPYTTMAANLYHLRTDIDFRLKDDQHLGEVLERLYPTPAVCGIPKDETREFILRHEHQPRKYYSGFVGPLMMRGKTSLFVSLRCMNILLEDSEGAHLVQSSNLGTCELYAGGGLLKESEMEKEWNETEAKMQTILSVLKRKESV